MPHTRPCKAHWRMLLPLVTENHRGTRAIHAKGHASTGAGVSPIKMPPIKGKSKRRACQSSFEVFIVLLAGDSRYTRRVNGRGMPFLHVGLQVAIALMISVPERD